MSLPPPTIAIPVSVEHDGHYWVVSCPSLRMTAAHVRIKDAWITGVSMFTGQICDALNHNPTLNGLMDEHDEALEALRETASSGTEFQLRFEDGANNLRFDMPGIMAAC